MPLSSGNSAEAVGSVSRISVARGEVGMSLSPSSLSVLRLRRRCVVGAVGDGGATLKPSD